MYWPAIFVLLVCLLQVNITLLQASVVEEMISFSALDNIRDLTCVSLFAVCFDAITARFCCSNQVSSLYLLAALKYNKIMLEENRME